MVDPVNCDSLWQPRGSNYPIGHGIRTMLEKDTDRLE